MATLFYGLNIASNALKTQTAVLNVTAHNVANAETPGYSRQTVVVSSIADQSSRGLRSSSTLSIGNGVEAREVMRSRFALYDSIFRNENQNLNDNIKTEELMNQVELLFDEPSERGLSQTINDFFNGWQEVANDPQNTAARESLRSYGEELAARLNRLYTQLDVLREDIDNEVATIPGTINEITSEIASLNVSIRAAESQNASANDLRDKRDYLVDQLSDYVDVRAIEQSDGTYTVIIGSQVVVEHEDQMNLVTVSQMSGEGGSMRTSISSAEGIEYFPQKGKLGSLIRFRDEYIGEIQDKLNVFTEALVNAVNYEHSYGYGLDGSTNLNFFNPQNTKAFNIEISNDIADVRKIAASGDGTYGDNSNALRVNDIKDVTVINNQYTLSQYYNALVSSIGILAREAQASRMNEELLVTQVDNLREGIKGVDIDSELIQMITSQRLYQGASRLVVVLDSMLEATISMK